MIRLAALYRPLEEIHYTGLDRFEDRTSQDGPGMTLKLAHRLLRRTGARIRLWPGEPLETVGRRANELGQFDLVVFSWRLDYRRGQWAWFFVPRLLHQQSLLFRERPLPGGRLVVEPMDHSELAELARAYHRRRAA